MAAVIPVRRRAPTKVVVFQWPWGMLMRNLCPRGARPYRRAILVEAQVSSMKTRRSGSRVEEPALSEAEGTCGCCCSCLVPTSPEQPFSADPESPRQSHPSPAPGKQSPKPQPHPAPAVPQTNAAPIFLPHHPKVPTYRPAPNSRHPIHPATSHQPSHRLLTLLQSPKSAPQLPQKPAPAEPAEHNAESPLPAKANSPARPPPQQAETPPPSPTQPPKPPSTPHPADKINPAPTSSTAANRLDNSEMKCHPERSNPRILRVTESKSLP